MKSQVSPNVIIGIAAISILLSIVGAMLPWASLNTIFWGTYTVSGTQGDGRIIIVLAIAAAVVLVWFYLARTKLAMIVMLVLGIGIAGIGLVDIINLNRVIDVDPEIAPLASVGLGLYIVLLSGMTLAGCAALFVFGEMRNHRDDELVNI